MNVISLIGGCINTYGGQESAPAWERRRDMENFSFFGSFCGNKAEASGGVVRVKAGGRAGFLEKGTNRGKRTGGGAVWRGPRK